MVFFHSRTVAKTLHRLHGTDMDLVFNHSWWLMAKHAYFRASRHGVGLASSLPLSLSHLKKTIKPHFLFLFKNFSSLD